MSCFSCTSFSRKDVRDIDDDVAIRPAESSDHRSGGPSLSSKSKEIHGPKGNVARSFTFRELAVATRNFREVNLIGEGGFGMVYRGRLESGQASTYYAVQRNHNIPSTADLDVPRSCQSYTTLIPPVHKNSSLGCRTWDWGIPRDLGGASVAWRRDFGVVLLELITGRKAIDSSRKPGEQNLIVWSRPFLKDRRKFVQLVDPMLQGHFPLRSLHHAVAITAMCLQEHANFRPIISDIVVALEYLASQTNKESPRGAAHSSSPPSPLQQGRNSFSG
ncbi:protein kinase superfamily protein [Actinidia rufa]|uniref:Protein kinase superfamily protein n=1 Tax=Actinidia rufa TaxID=165716 RepID=A0A7J0EK31_9ERIC|nr:protein kinase superfamily protein [Actinidia rufa]